mmetsp:Transcript_121837/g.215605  ORF Transcript_121837/g.215605 Transcript_121837/m.215605 type:complete len:158 (-) Transcript_121837:69-542(-)
MPLAFFIGGCVFVTLGAATRMICHPKTQVGWIVMLLSLSLSVFIQWGMTAGMGRAFLRTANTLAEFDELHLHTKDAQHDVDLWFNHTPTGGSLDACMHALGAEVISEGCRVVVGLNSISKEKVAMCYHRKKAEIMGVELSNSELYQISTGLSFSENY